MHCAKGTTLFNQKIGILAPVRDPGKSLNACFLLELASAVINGQSLKLPVSTPHHLNQMLLPVITIVRQSSPTFSILTATAIRLLGFIKRCSCIMSKVNAGLRCRDESGDTRHASSPGAN